MRVLVLGGGKVGSTIASILCDHHHDVTVVELDKQRAKLLDESLDISVITGSASHADVLFQADATSAEICLAVTGSDEVNLVAARIAKLMGVRRVAAHVYSPSIHDRSTCDYQQLFHIDRLLSIEAITAAEFARQIRDTGDMMIEHFASGEVELQEILIFNEPPPNLKKPLCELKFPAEVRVGVIRRNTETGTETKIAGATDTIQQGDRITLIGDRGQIEKTKKLFQAVTPKPKRVLIGGGGETGFLLAKTLLGRRYEVTILELDRSRCESIASRLPGCTVSCGDATNRSTLQNEQINSFHAFIAVTGGDEDNMIAALEAKEYNPKLKTMVLINRPDYAVLTEKLKVDKAIVPASVIANQVLGLLNSGAIVFRNSQLFPMSVDIVEFEVREGSQITKDILRNIKLPQGSLFAAVIRDSFVQVPSADFVFKPGDLVVALVNPDKLNELIKVF